MRLILFIVLASQLIGCAHANLVKKVYHPEKGGTIAYLNEGAGFVINGRIEDGQKKMRDYCGGDEPLILSESHNEESSGGTVSKDAFGVTRINNYSSDWVYIDFKCPVASR